jgi:uncharacterized lipoprotein (TIGR02269 family)
MRALRVVCVLILAVSWSGCATATRQAVTMAECHDSDADRCVSLLCLGDTCGFYRCEDVPGDVALARFPPARPPAATAAPGMGPRRNWGGAGKLPGGAVMVFPNWIGGPERLIPPSHQLTPGRWEKHHIFPQEERLALWFDRQGVKIHDYTMPIPRDVHLRIHNPGGRGGPWNQAWRDFRTAKPDATPEEIFKHAGELIHRFGLIGGPIQPYYSRPGA